MDTVAPIATTIRQDPQATIIPAPPDPDTGAGRAIAALAGQTAELGSLAQRVRLEGTLGSGGMGEVLLAEQLSVGRKVAVKRLRAGVSGDAAVSALLREGWVTGTLEHPNVMPLYDLGLDDQGCPLMVLKRIEGAQWRELISDAQEVQRRFGTGLLEWNLQIIMQLCNAVGFAHSKGIIHRDIKPENVMIGEFGEVYLLDWGIAVALDDDGTGRLPAAKKLGEIAGTPNYMAPEMLDWGARRLSARTDVYLLGASLYEVLCGAPPHQADSLEGFIDSVLRSEPQIPSDVPDELAEICQRSLSPSSDDRYASAEELRLAVQAYLDHRGSSALAKEAGHRLQDLRAALRGSGEVSLDRLALYEAFSECRFGFRQALAAWSDNEDARSGLVRATELMIEFELSAGDPRAAAALLAELGAEASADLRDQVEQALASAKEREAEIEKLREFRADRDSRTGRNTRRFIVGVAGVFWAATPLLAYFFPQYADRHEPFIAVPLISLPAFGALAWWARDSVSKSFVNRSIVFSILASLFIEATINIVGLLMDVPAPPLQVFHFLSWATVTAFLAIGFLPKLWWVPVVYVVGMYVSAWRRDLRFATIAVSHILMILGVAAWAPLSPEDQK